MIIIIISSRDFFKKIWFYVCPFSPQCTKCWMSSGAIRPLTAPPPLTWPISSDASCRYTAHPYLMSIWIDPCWTLTRRWASMWTYPSGLYPRGTFWKRKWVTSRHALFSKNDSFGNISQNHDNDTKSKSITPFRFCVRAAHAYKREMVHYELLKGYRSVS